MEKNTIKTSKMNTNIIKRKIIKIDENLCNGCGLCVDACHESAIQLVDGKAKLMRDDYCDGLGNCLPACPTGAITFEEREALQYNEEEVRNNMKNKEILKNKEIIENKEIAKNIDISMESELRQWPIQIKLVSVNAKYFDGCHLLIAADCTAFAHGNFHNEFIKNKIALIGCPKLDDIDYSEKLTEIFKNNHIKSITVVRMEVPCCRGIEMAVKEAILKSEKIVPFAVNVISIEGDIVE
jgi:ferredoxin